DSCGHSIYLASARALGVNGEKSITEARSVHLGQFDAGVIRFENLFDVESLLRQAVGAELAHANAVTPAASGEDERGNPIVFVVDAIDYEELFLQTQR